MAKFKRLSLCTILFTIAILILNPGIHNWESISNFHMIFGGHHVQAAACDGDLDLDGQIDTTDLSLMVSAILLNNTAGVCADLNEDTAVNSLDLQLLTNLIIYPQSGDVYYIAQNGSDSNDGSLERPWRTVSYAWRNSGGGDTVLIRDGTYTQRVKFG